MIAPSPSAPVGDDTVAGRELPALEVRQLSKTFTATPALDRFSLTLRPGEVHALLGENGSGKSTFIKLLSGYHAPDPGGGEIRVRGEVLRPSDPSASLAVGCRFVHQDLGLVESSSVADNLALTTGFPTRLGTVRGRELRRQAAIALKRAGLDLDPRTRVADLSPAVKTGVAVARALREVGDSPVRVLVLDEPTATLPESEVRGLLDIVRAVAATGVAVLYVTHRLDEVFLVAHQVTVLRDGHKVITAATSSLTRASLVTHLVGRELDDTKADSDRLPDAGSEKVLDVSGLRSGVLAGVSFHVRAGDVVGIAGITGSGRESLLSAVFGGLSREAGTVTVAGQPLRAHAPSRAVALGLAYLPADRKLLSGVMGMSARENLTLADLSRIWRLPVMRRGVERAETRDWFERLDVRPRQGVDRPLSAFSGGNQQKVLFGKWLRCAPKVLLLDEPTQGVDIGAKAEIHQQILAAVRNGAAAVVASSDADELVALCHTVLVLRHGRISATLTGDDVTVSKVTAEALVDPGAPYS